MMKILAIDVGGTAIKSALAAPDGTLTGLRECPTPPDIARGILQVAAASKSGSRDWRFPAAGFTRKRAFLGMGSSIVILFLDKNL